MSDPIASVLAAAVVSGLRTEVGRAVEDALARALPAVVRRAALPPYLTKRQLAELTGWSERKLDYLRARGRLPYSKVGRSVLFKVEDVEHLLDEARVEARSTALLGDR